MVSRNTVKKHVDLLLIEEKNKRHYVLIKDFNIPCMIMLYIVENNFVIVLWTFNHINDCFKINGKQMTLKKHLPKEDGYVKFENYEKILP